MSLSLGILLSITVTLGKKNSKMYYFSEHYKRFIKENTAEIKNTHTQKTCFMDKKKT